MAPPSPPVRMVALGYRATPTTLAVGAQALARIWYPWRELLPTWSLRFLGTEPGFLGRTLWPERAIEVYVRPGQALDDVAFALAHEIGHAVDLEHLDPGARGRWRARRGISAHLEWFGASDANDFATPAGDWAECFAAWQIGPAGFQSQLGSLPDEATFDLMAELSLAGESLDAGVITDDRRTPATLPHGRWSAARTAAPTGTPQAQRHRPVWGKGPAHGEEGGVGAPTGTPQAQAHRPVWGRGPAHGEEGGVGAPTGAPQAQAHGPVWGRGPAHGEEGGVGAPTGTPQAQRAGTYSPFLG